MAVDQIEYCGACEYYAECKARKGEGECIVAVTDEVPVLDEPELS